MGPLSKYTKEFRRYPRWLQFLLPFSALVFVLAFASMVIGFPDNPISQQGTSYVGKYGAQHTRAEYEGYLALNRVMLVAGVAWFAALVCSVVYGAAQDR